MYIGRHVKYPLFFPGFNETNFLEIFSKNTQISKGKSVQWEPTERHDEANSSSWQFCERA